MTGHDDEMSVDKIEEWRKRYETKDESAKELFGQISQIAIYLSYDLIDKLRFFEKETLKLEDSMIEQRLPHMSTFLEQLKTAYETFSDVDF